MTRNGDFHSALIFLDAATTKWVAFQFDSIGEVTPPLFPNPTGKRRFRMSAQTPEQPLQSKSAARAFAGMGVGLPVGGLTWAATGWFSGAVLMLFIWVVMRFAKGAEYRGDFQGDLFWVARWGGIILGSLGLLAGLIIGGRVGWRGEPLLAGTVMGSWNSFGVIAIAVGVVLAPFAAAGLASSSGSDSPSDQNA